MRVKKKDSLNERELTIKQYFLLDFHGNVLVINKFVVNEQKKISK